VRQQEPFPQQGWAVGMQEKIFLFVIGGTKLGSAVCSLVHVKGVR